MNIENLQATLRHFAAERDWERFHTPKNLATALVVQAAGVAEVFQWMTPDESRDAQSDPASEQRIGDELAGVLLHLLQLADHTQVDLAQAVNDKLVRDAVKHPAKRVIPVTAPKVSPPPDTHILLDYENVQPTEIELRAMVPEATRLWAFHGPHQKHVEERFASYGEGMTPVPISRTGKNALDFHLSFYMGYIVSRNQRAKMVVVANDRGYKPMLEHAKALGFAVRQHGHARAAKAPGVRPTATPKAIEVAPKKAPAKKTAAKPVSTQPGAKKAAIKKVAAKKAPAKKTVVTKARAPQPAAEKAAKATSSTAMAKPDAASAFPVAGGASAVSPSLIQKMTDSLRKMGDKRPHKQASLRRALKPLLGAAASDESIGVALNNLIARSVVAIGATGVVTYPQFADSGSASAIGAAGAGKT